MKLKEALSREPQSGLTGFLNRHIWGFGAAIAVAVLVLIFWIVVYLKGDTISHWLHTHTSTIKIQKRIA